MLKKPKRILEIGTAIGYSSIIMNRAYPDSIITTIEIDEKNFLKAKEFIKRAGCEKNIDLIYADANDALDFITDEYDMIFMDAAKGQYISFFEKSIERLNHRGILVSDNILFRGLVAKEKNNIRRKNTIVKRLKEFLKIITNSDKFSTTIIPIDDGICPLLDVFRQALRVSVTNVTEDSQFFCPTFLDQIIRYNHPLIGVRVADAKHVGPNFSRIGVHGHGQVRCGAGDDGNLSLVRNRGDSNLNTAVIAASHRRNLILVHEPSDRYDGFLGFSLDIVAYQLERTPKYAPFRVDVLDGQQSPIPFMLTPGRALSRQGGNVADLDGFGSKAHSSEKHDKKPSSSKKLKNLHYLSSFLNRQPQCFPSHLCVAESCRRE